jgi:hypothetical protein
MKIWVAVSKQTGKIVHVYPQNFKRNECRPFRGEKLVHAKIVLPEE